MERKKFSRWTADAVERTFSLQETQDLPSLQKWLHSSAPIADDEQQKLRELQKQARRRVTDWNEEELKIKFIGPIIALAQLDGEEYHTFFERELKATIEGIAVGGTVDLLLAEGRRAPHKAYFSLHEYKKERHSANDPLGQLLIALLAAQTLNADGQTLYGCYVVGRNWFFITLDGKEYAESLAYDATQDDIFDIHRILKTLKTVVEYRIQNKV
jgi:hypothetical protein